MHAGLSHDLKHLALTASLAMGAWMGKPTISITDIDGRRSAEMNHRLGRWSLKSYLLCRYVYDPVRDLQQRLAVRWCSLVLFKGETLVRDYGRGRANVRGMWDPGFSACHVIGRAALDEKLEALRDRSRPLEVLYFGRLTGYKGVDRIIEAVAGARARGRADVRLTIMGSGEDEALLRRLASERGLGSAVRFLPPVRYGEEMFSAIRPHHLMLAAPLTTDTPRSTWDAIASGIPVLAFDTEFYRSLEAETGVVETVPWPSVDALAEKIAHYAEHREPLAERMERAVAVARENTSEHWLRRRADWTLELVGYEPQPTPQLEVIAA
ncbi:MAG: glycosyltransferase [Sandaracinaceae bacterium]|nr:glycosyltransferase [Sandaracinaceae bacterium]